jgi:PAS domain S-box-containing protein
MKKTAETPLEAVPSETLRPSRPANAAQPAVHSGNGVGCHPATGTFPETGKRESLTLLKDLNASSEPNEDLHKGEPISLFLIDSRGRIRNVDQAGADLLDCSRQELLLSSFLHYIATTADKKTFSAYRKRTFLSQTPGSIAIVLRRNDGALVPVRIETRAAENGDGNAGYISISVLKTTEAGSSEAKPRADYSALFRNMPHAFALCKIILDDRATPCDYRYVDVNTAYENLCGVARDRILGRTAREHNAALDASWLERLGAVALTGTPIRFEHYVAPLEKWLEVYAYAPEPGMFASIIRDVTDQRRDRDEVCLTEDRSRVLLDQLPHAVFVKDTRSVYRFGNRSFAQSLGITQAEIPGKTDYDLFPGHLAEKYREDDGKISKHGQVLSVEEYYPGFDGKRWVSTVKVPVTDSSGSVTSILGIFSDISDRKRAEEALRQSRELYRCLAEAGPVLVWSADGAGRPDFVNSRWCQYTGLTLDDLQARGWKDLCHPDDVAMLTELGSGASEQGGPVEAEFRFRRFDGQYRWFWASAAAVKDASGKAVKWVGIALDITERRQAEEALHRNEELLREYVKLLEYAPVIVRNMRDEILLWNRGMEKIYGYSAIQAIGRNVHAFLETRFPEPPEAILATLEKTGRWEGDLRHKAADGREILVTSLWILHKNLQGQATAIIEVNADITDRRRAEDGLSRAHAELERRAAELDAVNRELEAYSYTVSHDLKGPLCNIEGFTRALLEDFGDRLDGTGRDYLKRVNSASLRMRQLVEALLNMARLSAGEIRGRVVDLSALARVILQDLRHQEQHRHADVTIADNLTAHGDADMLQVVLQNLLANAWKFTGKRENAVIEFGMNEQGSRKIFFVRDNGAGFPMEYAGNIFMPFKRFHASSEFPGIGIGLATAHRIITRHNGRIWAESAPDLGATFYFTL